MFFILLLIVFVLSSISIKYEEFITTSFNLNKMQFTSDMKAVYLLASPFDLASGYWVLNFTRAYFTEYCLLTVRDGVDNNANLLYTSGFSHIDFNVIGQNDRFIVIEYTTFSPPVSILNCAFNLTATYINYNPSNVLTLNYPNFFKIDSSVQHIVIPSPPIGYSWTLRIISAVFGNSNDKFSIYRYNENYYARYTYQLGPTNFINTAIIDIDSPIWSGNNTYLSYDKTSNQNPDFSFELIQKYADYSILTITANTLTTIYVRPYNYLFWNYVTPSNGYQWRIEINGTFLNGDFINTNQRISQYCSSTIASCIFISTEEFTLQYYFGYLSQADTYTASQNVAITSQQVLIPTTPAPPTAPPSDLTGLTSGSFIFAIIISVILISLIALWLVMWKLGYCVVNYEKIEALQINIGTSNQYTAPNYNMIGSPKLQKVTIDTLK